jgi:hypothetical protein
VLTVRGGETAHVDISASMVGLPLPAMITYADGACLNRAQLSSDAHLSSLWEEVRRGVEIRQAFGRQYRFQLSLTQESETSIPGRVPARRVRADTSINEPTAFFAREAQRRARREAGGYGRGNTLQLPDEEELLDDAFLRDHCVVPVLKESDSGAIGIAFRPSTQRRDGFGLRGTIWVDSTTHLMRRLNLEYLDGNIAFSEVTVEYADVLAAGASLRLPNTGAVTLRPLQAPRGTTITGALRFAYWGFVEARSN